MNLHEYQAKALLKEYGMPVQEGILATNADEAVAAFEQLGKFAVMKAQVHAGGRGKAGGVKVAKSKRRCYRICKQYHWYSSCNVSNRCKWSTSKQHHCC